MSMTRREFLATTGAAAAAMGASTAPAAQTARGANERLGLALIGCGGQGRHAANSILQAGGDSVAVIGAADVDPKCSAGFRKSLGERGEKLEVVKDFRRLLDRKDIDLVVVGTPDHWHAICTILACQAGKDVYVEKPCSHNIREGRAMVTAARKYKRIVQVGQQQRSDPHFREAMAYLHDGEPLGPVCRTLTCNYFNTAPDGIGNPPDGDPPEGVDYDLWLGPAPKRPFNRNRFHVHFRWFFDYAGGLMGDWNVHLHDIVHWGMRVDAPLSVCAMGGKRVLRDNRETPDMMDVLFEYPTFTQTYVMDMCYQQGRYPNAYGTEFFGPKGSLFIDRGGWEVRPQTFAKEIDDPEKPGGKKTVQEPRIPAIQKPGGDSVLPHAKNFLHCVRSRKHEDLHCDIEVGHRTASVCHLGNIALRVGRRIWWDAEKELITLHDGRPDPEANAWLGREYRKGYELPSV